MEFEVVKRGFGEKRKYYFKGSDGKIYGEGYEDYYFKKDKKGRKLLVVVEGFARVEKDGKWYFADVNNGFKLCGEGYDDAYACSKGFAQVKKDAKYFYVNLKELRKTGSSHDYKYDEYREGFNVVYENGKYYFINEDFKLHGEGYDDAYACSKGFALVEKDDKQFYVNLEELRKTGSSHDYKHAKYREGFNVVYENGKYYFIDEDFNLHGEGYDDAYNFSEGFAVVKKDGKWYYVDKNFELHGEGYDDADNFEEGFAAVKKGKQEYTINKNFERIKRNNQIMEDVDYLQEAKDDVKSIVGIPAIRFSEEFVKELKAIVLKYFQKEIREVEDGEIEELKSDMKYIAGLIEEKKKQYSKVSPKHKRLLKEVQSLFESENANKNKPDGNSGNTDENNTDDNSSDEEQK